MSITLPKVDLSSAVVGTTGAMPLQASGLVAIPSQQPPFLAIFNDSGAGLLITLTVSQQQFYLSAKGHILVAISNKETEIKYSVQNVATNIQVNQLWATYFYPGEQVTDFSALGTSTVSQQATTLVNTGNAPFTPIFFAEPAGDNSVLGAVQITNAGFLQLGDATYQGDITISGPDGKTTTITNDALTTPTLSVTSTAANSTSLDNGAIASSGSGGMTFGDALKINLAAVTVNGQTSGHADLYEYLQGTIKKVIVHLVNYKNTAIQTLALPVAFTDRAWLWMGEVQGTNYSFLTGGSGGAAVNIKIMTDGAGGAAGTQTTQTTIAQWSHGQIDAAWDTLKIAAMVGGAANGVIVIEGF